MTSLQPAPDGFGGVGRGTPAGSALTETSGAESSLVEDNAARTPWALGNVISYTTVATGGLDLLQFKFTTPGFGAVVNGSNLGANDLRSFFVTFCTAANNTACNVFTGPNTNEAILAFDDSGGNPDDNHDDWYGRVRISALNREVSVPDGGLTAGLLGVALIGLGALRQKFNL